MRATAGEPKRDTRIPQMPASASILTTGGGDPTISIGGESTRAADTGGPKVLGSNFRELRRLSPNTTRPASPRAEFFVRRFDLPNSVELWRMRAGHIDELIAQSVVTGLRGTHRLSR